MTDEAPDAPATGEMVVLTLNEQLAIVNGRIKALEQEKLNRDLDVAVTAESRRAPLRARLGELDEQIAALVPIRQGLLDAGADATGIATGMSPGAQRRMARGLAP